MRDEPVARRVTVVSGVSDGSPAEGLPRRAARRELIARWSQSPWRWVGGGLAVLLVAAAALLMARDAPRKPLPPWPTAPGACRAPVPLALVDSAPLQTSGIVTGLEVLVGPARRVVLDTGSVGEPVDFEGLVVTQLLVRGPDVDLLMSGCDSSAAYLVRVDAGGHAAVADTGPIIRLLPDGDTVWSVHEVPNGRDFFLYDSVGDRLVWLPVRFEPLAVRGSIVVGRQRSTDPQAVPGLSLMDAATGDVIRSYPNVTAVTVGDDAVLFAIGPCEGPTPCPLSRLDLATGEETAEAYSLPSGAGFANGVLSHDGNRLAFPLSHRQADPRYDLGDGKPADLAVLDLRTGDLSRIGGIELPGTAPAAALTFSPDDAWLVIAVSEGTRTRLLAWRPGLDRPLESPASIVGTTAPRPALGLAARTSAIGP